MAAYAGLGYCEYALAAGSEDVVQPVDVIAGDATSALIDALDLTALDDTRQYFPPYDAAPVVRTLVTRVCRRYLKGVEIDVRPEATIRMDKQFRVKFLGGKRGLGRFKGTIHISHIKGQLTVAGDPQVSFQPPSELVITAPVRLLGGRSTVTMDLDWKPAFLVSAVCRGFRFNETLAGEILPFGRKGIKVRLPPRIFKPFQLPVVLDGFFKAGNFRVEARAFDPAIAVQPEYMRLAFRTNLRVISTPDTVRETPAMVPAVRPDSAPARQ